MMIAQTDRLMLRKITEDDWLLILTILNDPDFVRFVGDRGIRTETDARTYIIDGPLSDYVKHGFGMWVVEQSSDGQVIGGCGLFQRDYLDAPDIGFALLPIFRGQGYAYEISAAIMKYGQNDLGIERILATVNPANERSIRLLEKLGLRYEKMITIGKDTTETALYTTQPVGL